MDRESKVYALVLGTLVAALREKSQMRQGALADRAGLTSSTLSRIERGQVPTDVFTLRALVAALGLDQAAFLALLEETWRRTERAAQQVLPLEGGAPWWKLSLDQVGQQGVAGLVTFTVASVLSAHVSA